MSGPKRQSAPGDYARFERVAIEAIRFGIALPPETVCTPVVESGMG